MKRTSTKTTGIFICLFVIILSSLGLFLATYNSNTSTTKKLTLNTLSEDEEKEGSNKRQYIEEAFKQEFERTKDPALNTVPRERLFKAREVTNHFMLGQSAQRAIPGINWEERGPSIVGGRTRALIFDKRDASGNTIFSGGVAGGLWKGTNLDAPVPTWTKISDVFENVAISCIVQDPTNFSILYFGTGETWGNVDAMRGLGIWKSRDGGESWAQLVSTNNPDFYYTQKIVINSSGHVFAATSAGLKKSMDGGLSWATVLDGDMTDIEIASNNDLYTANFLGRVFKSTAANGGASGTWANITPPGNYERIEIATAPSDAQKLYLLCEGSGTNDCTAIFRTDNGGANWIAGTVPTIIDQGSNSNFTRGQAWYDLIAAVDPNAPNTVLIGGVDGLRSTDGAATWKQITTWSLFNAVQFKSIVHADHHAIEYAPGSSSRAVWGTDGGVYLTNNVNVEVTDSIKPTFTAENDGYNITQFYACAIHPDPGSNYFLGGTQDNGSRKFNDFTPGIQQTASASGGDGAFCHIDQLNPAKQITSYVYNYYFRSLNGGISFPAIIGNTTRGSFINPTDYDNKSKFLYGDATVVATGAGGSYSRWNTDSSAAYFSFVNVTNFAGASVTNVYVSPNIADRVYFGLSNGRVVYVDGASTPGTTKAGVIVKTGVGSVSGIVIEPEVEDHMLVTYSNYGVQSVFESLNITAAAPLWTNIENNLPDMPVRWVIFHPTNADQALIATELGVWTTDDLDGANTEWTPTNGGLANTRIDMLKVRRSDNLIAAASHGRGLFTTTFSNTVMPNINFREAKAIAGEIGNVPLTCNLSYRDIPVTLMLSNPASTDVTVNITIEPTSTAWKGVDFDLSQTMLTFPAGTTTPQTFNVRVYDDFSKEATESLLLSYSIASGSSAAAKGTTFQTFQMDIVDNDFSPSGPTLSQFSSGIYNTNLGPSSPLQSTQSDKKAQYLYRASELLANGLKAGKITSLYFSVASLLSSTPYNGFTIKLGSVPATQLDLSTGFVTPADLTTIYSAPATGFVPLVGENIFPITQGYTWDGVSNIIFEYCFNNNAAGAAGSDDLVAGETMGYVCQARRTSVLPADDGCAYTSATTVATARPVIMFTQPIPETPVAVALNATRQAPIGPFETIHYFEQTTGRIIASVENLDGWNYGCTNITIDRAGTNARPFTSNNPAEFLAAKTVYISPANNNPNGHVRVTLYFTEEEKAGWEAATSRSWSAVDMFKVNDAHIFDVTPANPSAGSVSSATTVVRTTIGANHAITGEFNTGFSGFGVGNVSVGASLPVTMLNFKGKIQNDHAVLEWSTASEQNNKGFFIEKSESGNQFRSIGFVPGKGNSATIQKYSFTDPEVSTKVQYYRLKQVDKENKPTTSDVVLLRTKSHGISVTPNPFTDHVNVRFTEPVNGKTEAFITDLSGKILLRAAINAVNSSSWRLNTGNRLLPGMYLLKITNNGTTQSYKIVKN